MEELESQIAKIQLGNTKASSTYVYIMAEKAAGSSAELYVVAELPLFNPAAEEACERICLAIASTLKRSYKRQINENSFENAISQINEELGKLASLGQTQWIDKLNCILGVKQGHNFNIATCGKVSAFLLRNKEYTDISCSQTQSHPLKTFENFALGKVRLGDLLILSTTQLFNHLSMGRLMDIVSGSNFLTATQTVIELLKENADPQTSFAILLNLQVQPGQTTEEDVDLENYIVESPAGQPSLAAKLMQFAKSTFAMDKGAKRIPKVELPKVSLQQKFKNFSGNTKEFFAKSGSWWKMAKTSASAVKATVNPQKFKAYGPIKKFLIVSVLILLVALVANVSIALHLKKTKQISQTINTQLKQVQTALSNAQASLLYKDDVKAAEFLKKAEDAMPKSEAVDSSNKDFYDKVLSQLQDTKQQMEKIVEVNAENLGSLGEAKELIKLPNYLAVQVNGSIISYNKQNGKIEDSNLKLGITALSVAYLDKNTAAVYDGSSLYVWDFSTGKLGSGFSQSVPNKDSGKGLAQYPTNNRIYMIDSQNATIVNYLAGTSSFSKPVVAVREPSLSSAIDLSIDGSIYVLNKNGVNKFQSGKLADFSLPQMPTPLSGSGKIYTQKDFKNIYILDAGNNRLLAVDKNGQLVYSLKSKDFTKLKDFQVDEKNKVIYLYNDTSLLKATLP